jgi:hydroxyacylglutathione hydrolase
MSKLYFRQLLAGRDFALDDPSATQMENFVYLIGDEEKKQCVVVDPAWDVAGILRVANLDGFKVVGALATHYHPDHVGGHIFGMNIEGIAELLAQNPCPIHAHKLEREGIARVTGVELNDITPHESHDVVKVGDIEIELLHTPGHTPGSLCFCLKNALVSGDTLFLRGCGRVDLPGGNVEEMYRTMNERLSKINNDVTVYPGHAYGGEQGQMSQLRKTNAALQHTDMASFRRMFTR